MCVSMSLVKWLALGIFLWPLAVAAHDMNDPDAEWYRSLVVPGAPGQPLAGSSCCNGGSGPDVDCKNVDVRQARDPDGSIHWEAYIDAKTFPDEAGPHGTMGGMYSLYGHAPNDWVRVPDNVIIRGKNNPTGGFVACWYNRTIRCFVEGTGT